MVTKEELKDVLRKEEVKAIYDSIDSKKLDKLEQESIEYNEYTKKEYHPISYQVNQEHEEWWNNHPLKMELWNTEMVILNLYFAYLGMWLFISLMVILYAISGL